MIPKSTILIENPVAVVDGYADKHGTREAGRGVRRVPAHAPRRSARSPSTACVRSLPAVADEVGDAASRRSTDLFTIRDLGDWADVQTRDLRARAPVYDAALGARAGSRASEPAPRSRSRPGRAQRAVALAVALYVVLLVAVPLVALVHAGFADGLARAVGGASARRSRARRCG